MRTGLRLLITFVAGAALLAGAILADILPLASARDLALTQRWRWVHFDRSSGLPHREILSVVETPAGTVWVGTRAGVAHFDGYRWTAGEGLPEIRAGRLATHGDDEIVVVMGGSLYRGGRQGFHRIDLGADTAAGTLCSVARLDDAAAIVLVNRQLFRLRLGEADVEPFPLPDGVEVIQALWGTRRAPWLLARCGLFRWNHTRWERMLSHFPGPLSMLSPATQEGFPELVYVLYPASERGFHILRDGQPPLGLGHAGRDYLPTTYDVSAEGAVCVAYETGEVIRWSNGRWQDLSLPLASQPQINEFRFRRTGDLWVATDRGLFLCRESQPEWSRRPSPAKGPRNQINEIVMARDGAMWVGTGDGVEEHRPDGTVRWHGAVGDVPVGHVTAVQEDAAGHIWIGSGGSFTGVYRWDGTEWHHLGGERLGRAYIHKIRRDRSGRLWFLGLGALGQRPPGEPDREPGAFVLTDGAIECWDETTGLGSGRVYAFEEGPDGAYWFGTMRFLSRYRDGTWKHWPICRPDQQRRVFALTLDRLGQVWFTDRATGLGRLEGDEIRWFTSEDGLPSDLVNEIRLGADGALWVGTRRGITRLAEGRFDSLTTQHGLSGHAVWALLPLADRIYIGTQANGTDVLHLSEISSRAPRVHLEDPIVEDSNATLPLSVNAFWGRIPPSEIPVRHRIDSGPWSAWSSRRPLHFGNLDSGEHRVEVEAKGFLGSVAPTPATTTIRIEPPLALRPAFFVPVGLLLVSLLSLGAFSIVRKMRDNRRIRDTLRQLLESEEKLRQAQKMEAVGKLAGGIAHDFNNLLVAILGHCDLVTMTGRPDAETRTHVDEIRKAGERAESLTRQLLAFSRKQMLRPQTLDLNLVISDLHDLLRRLIGEDVQVSIDLTEDPVIIHADRQQVEQVVLNLVTNARDAMPEGGRLEISTRLIDRPRSRIGDGEELAEGRYAMLSLADTGDGMPADLLERIFEPFFTTKDVGKGTGLGLSTAYGTVRQSGGEIRVRSTPGEGSVFEVFLPAKAEEAPRHAAQDESVPLMRGRETVLVVEDEPAVGGVVRTTLGKAGYRVLLAESGAEALEIATEKGREIHLVLADVVMPNMGGQELGERLGEMLPDLRILYMTGYTEDARVRNGLSENGVGLIEKPFTPATLARRVREALDR